MPSIVGTFGTPFDAIDSDVLKLFSPETVAATPSFSSTIPAGSTIVGMQVDVTAFIGDTNSGASQDDMIKVSTNAGSDYSNGTTPSPLFGTTPMTNTTFGGSTFLWGLSDAAWDAFISTPSNMRILLTPLGPNGNLFYIDYLRVVIYYSDASIPTGGQLNFSSGRIAISEGRISL